MKVIAVHGLLRLFCLGALAIPLCLVGPALGQGRGELLALAPDSPERIEALGRDVERAASLREIKDLQILYSQFAQFGLWDEIGGLLADDVELWSDDKMAFKGRAAFVQHLKDEFNGGKEGLPNGAFHTDLLLQPVVILSYDGKSASARWTRMLWEGQYDPKGGNADISGGMHVDDYVKENGVWKISRLHYFPQYAGPYETGFFASKKSLPLAPYPYTPGQVGHPVPDQPSGVDRSGPTLSLAESERRIARMADADQVRNLQNIYGYYIDRKMWSDVVDLFSDDSVLEIAGQGVWAGPKSIRRALEVNGPEGLQRGEAYDHIQMNAIVTVDPNGGEARARGLDVGMLTPKLGEAYWSAAIFENRYVKGQDGKWRIREMRLYPVMKTDYYQGWGKSRIIDPVPSGAHAPDKPSAADNALQASGAIPVFDFPNPGTGKTVSYPAGTKIVGWDRLLPSPATTAAAITGSIRGRLANARHQLELVKAYDAVENVSNTFGYYLDDTMWDQMAAIFAVNGMRPQGPGFYVGPAHILKAMTETHYDGPPSPTNPRDHLNLHQRLQPVIDIDPDGLTAKVRTRLFLFHAAQPGGSAGTFSSGMYPNETFALEGDVWKMVMGGEIDETYVNSPNWKQGWGKPQARAGRPPTGDAGWRPGMPPPASGITNTIDFPPDIFRTEYDGYRWKDMQATNWPDIKPMWFAYRNPVSGRTPPHYCPDFLKCGGY